MYIKTLALAASAATMIVASGCANMYAPAAPAMLTGGALVAPNGMTLYTFDKDAAGSGKSTCNGPCAALWPPAMAAADAKPEGELTLVTRDDGTKQWAYKGKPVYLYAADKKPGEMAGDKFRDMWHIIK